MLATETIETRLLRMLNTTVAAERFVAPLHMSSFVRPLMQQQRTLTHALSYVLVALLLQVFHLR